MLKRSLIACALVAGLTACNQTGQQSSAPVAEQAAANFNTYSAETFFDTTRIMGSAFRADAQKVLISSDKPGVLNLYEVDVKSGNKTQLTQSSETTYPIRYFPNDNRILFTRDNQGNERFHLFVRHEDGQIKDLTPGEKVKANFVGFSQDGKQFYVLSNKRDERFMDLYRYDSKTYENELVYKNEQNLNVQSLSKTERYLALWKNQGNKDTDLFLLDLKKPDAPLIEISNVPHEAQFSATGFSKDDKYLYYGTNAHGEFYQMWRYEIATQKHTPYIEKEWDVRFLYFSDSDRYRVVGVNEDSSMKVTVTDLKTGKDIRLPKLPAGSIKAVNFSADEKLMSFHLNSDTAPNNLFVWQVGSDSVKQLTSTLSDKINPEHLVESTIARFNSFDGLEVPGVLYKPKLASATNKVPAMIFVHGGPGGQSRTGYSARTQHLVNQGYAVFAVNNRGSSGYGKTFFHLDDKRHGEDDLQDIVWGKKYLQELDWVDPERIGIMGGSYGGYMTAAALAFEPEEFKVGINIFGVTNWVRTLESIPPWWESFRKSLYEELGDPAVDGERLRRISPLFHAKNITKPLLVVQGANDPRVLQVESDELVEAVRSNNVPVEYVLFEDEGHGFTKKQNRIEASQAYLDFLKQHL
ncbi:S9 family peptidase [Pseudoalteromonas luteoviolacea]|uniref:Peptidase S9 n=1 Tax=Pseudoalteromonas luteoviolacea H33 TaxID=1365251 RepID=A0A167FSX9_9GAMM|nr:alpha/beta fold hydrolase [Pseudoalteromonas luteoviolacea]KZN52943.1 peptidase S9 [Pseudoalteromonas luteoviolacea H33]KZN78140.1 peptidase S9 [Pseudoalteromonas luteoviolacea H33-S]MBQ4875758.1 S9 family peptidase [Pseudoalteromonas luteoviolacea]MBQ4904793.1 S9 family peptidase [Pseudoalteromonas luteoviolacea]